MQCRLSQKDMFTETPTKAAHWTRKWYFYQIFNSRSSQGSHHPLNTNFVCIHLWLSTTWLRRVWRYQKDNQKKNRQNNGQNHRSRSNYSQLANLLNFLKFPSGRLLQYNKQFDKQELSWNYKHINQMNQNFEKFYTLCKAN